MFDASWYEVWNGISGLFFIALGLVVGRVRPRRPSNRAFALFAVTFGAGVAILNLVLPGHPIAPVTLLERTAMVTDSLLWLGAAAGLAWLAAAAPRPRRTKELRWVLAAVLVTAAYLAAGVGVAVGLRRAADLFFFVCFHALLGTMWGLCVLFARRFLVASERDAAGYAAMSAALALYPAFWAALQFSHSVWVAGTREITALNIGFFLAPAFLVAAVWSGVILRSSGPRARMARSVVWSCLGAALAGLLAAPSSEGSEHWGYGAARFLAVALLAFAIVRGQAPGIDGRLRFGVSRSTIAAAFVAVFFIVSEGAQLVLGQGNQTVGLLAAGALVFVLSPLQRAAERLAEKAVPGAPQAAPSAGAAVGAKHPEVIFRQALDLAIRDGRLTREEEVRCAELAESLGIGAGRAAAILHERLRAHESVS